MKQYTIAILPTRTSAEKAINTLHTKLGVGEEEISYVYQNTDGEIKEVDPNEVSGTTTGEGAMEGATIGGAIGAIAGLATAIGVIPVLGPIFVAGPLIAALGIGSGIAGATAAGAVTGVATGGLIGAIVSFGFSETTAKKYEDSVRAGNVCVTVHTDADKAVVDVFKECGATDIEVVNPV